jgi:hypothetical protein
MCHICIMSTRWIYHSFLAAIVAAPLLAAPEAWAQKGRSEIIDIHAHLLDGKRVGLDGAMESALGVMDEFNISTSFIMPPPQTVEQNRKDTIEIYGPRPTGDNPRFLYLGGGGSLNVMIQEALRAGQVTGEMRQAFRQRAAAILNRGAIGFGEMTAEHVSRRAGHPYVSAPPDHPLFVLLAEIAAEKGVPIDFHMEAIEQDMPRPKALSDTNPEMLKANIAAFERLLAHNRQAIIIWSHLGWDNTGDRTPSLTRRLLEAHSNLFLSIKSAKGTIKKTKLERQKALKPDWKALIEDFPDRFMIGSDLKYRGGGRTQGGRMKVYKKILKQLSPGARKSVASENARRIFKLNR